MGRRRAQRDSEDRWSSAEPEDGILLDDIDQDEDLDESEGGDLEMLEELDGFDDYPGDEELPSFLPRRRRGYGNDIDNDDWN